MTDFELYEYSENKLKEAKKRIAELEETINKLREQFALRYDLEDKIKVLEQENAELKEYNKYLKRQRQGGIQKQYNKVAIIKQQDEQLTKAKDLLQKVADVCGYPNYDIPVELYADIADFLKENSTYERIQKAKYNYTD